jgi:hypothetical protein
MSARDITLMILAVALASCKPFKGELINNVGQDVYLQIYDRNGKINTYGELKSGQALTLNIEVASIGSVRYRYDSSQCDLKSNKIRNVLQWEEGFWRIILKRCLTAEKG